MHSFSLSKNHFLSVFVLFASLLSLRESRAQDPGTGLVFASPEQLGSIPLASTPFSGEELPPQRDLSNKFPTPGNQGGQNSCVAWAVAYAMKSYQEHVEEGVPLVGAAGQINPARVFSPAFIYNQINNGMNGGSTFIDAINVLSQQGAATLAVTPYNEFDFLTKPTEAMKNAARPYRVNFWRRVNPVDIKEVKAQINAGLPVLIGAPVDQGFRNLGTGTWNGVQGAQGGGHAMIVVGYDDARQAFKLMNSWGTDWGDRGFGWISYGFFPVIVREAYITKDASNGPAPVGPAPVGPAPVGPVPVDLTAGISFFINPITHNVSIPGLGPCMQLTGTLSIPAGMQGRAQVIVQFYNNNGMGGKGVPVGSVNMQFATIQGQAATGTMPMIIPATGLTTTWSMVLPYYSLNIPRGMIMTPGGPVGLPITSFLVGEPTIFVDNFGVRTYPAFPFTVGL
jgi:hypothetical protein